MSELGFSPTCNRTSRQVGAVWSIGKAKVTNNSNLLLCKWHREAADPQDNWLSALSTGEHKYMNMAFQCLSVVNKEIRDAGMFSQEDREVLG